MKKIIVLLFVTLLTITAGFAQQDKTANRTIRLTVGDVTMSIDTENGGKIMSLKYKDKEMMSQLRWPESFR